MPDQHRQSDMPAEAGSRKAKKTDSSKEATLVEEGAEEPNNSS
jgi:hypothetical protein